MAEPPVFFLPDVPPDLQEDAYDLMADKVERSVPCMGKRVYSVTFDVNDMTWTATVGERLSGRKPIQIAPQVSACAVEDAARVLAIFPGDPYRVVTDADPHSGFESPFDAEAPRDIECFFWPRAR